MGLPCTLSVDLRGGFGGIYSCFFIRQQLTEIPPVLEKNCGKPCGRCGSIPAVTPKNRWCKGARLCVWKSCVKHMTFTSQNLRNNGQCLLSKRQNMNKLLISCKLNLSVRTKNGCSNCATFRKSEKSLLFIDFCRPACFNKNAINVFLCAFS